MIEVHPEPARALCDGPQSLTPAAFADLVAELRRWLPAAGRRLATAAETDRPAARERERRGARAAAAGEGTA
jgi:hypothetical protein